MINFLALVFSYNINKSGKSIAIFHLIVLQHHKFRLSRLLVNLLFYSRFESRNFVSLLIAIFVVLFICFFLVRKFFEFIVLFLKFNQRFLEVIWIGFHSSLLIFWRFLVFIVIRGAAFVARCIFLLKSFQYTLRVVLDFSDLFFEIF